LKKRKTAPTLVFFIILFLLFGCSNAIKKDKFEDYFSETYVCKKKGVALNFNFLRDGRVRLTSIGQDPVILEYEHMGDGLYYVYIDNNILLKMRVYSEFAVQFTVDVDDDTILGIKEDVISLTAPSTCLAR